MPRAGAPRTGTAARPGTTGRRPAPRTTSAPRTRTPGAVRAWGRRLAVLAGTTLALTTVLAALAQPPTEAGQVPGSSDALGQAQATAATLADATSRYRSALAAATAFDTQAQQARDAGAAARAAVATDRAAVGAYAAAAYRRSAQERWPLAQLSLTTPGTTTDVLHATGLAERLSDEQAAQVARAGTAAVHAATYTDTARAAETAAADARRTAAGVLLEVRELVAALDPAVSARWAGLGTSPAATAQQGRNAAALADWQGYLGQLATGGITPPPAADLTDPTDLPSGLAPLRDASGAPVAGVASTFVAGRTLTVLPAETVAAVSAAFSQLGKPYLADQSGPDGYGCGGLTSTAWTAAGVGLGSGLAEQWAAGTPVPVGQLQVGDLVFSTDARDGLDDVGLYLGGTSVLSASADRWQVAVRDVTDLSTAVRVTVPVATPTDPPVTGTGAATCGATSAPGTAAQPVPPAWGGLANGQIPRDQLCPVGKGQRLRCDAAAAYTAMSAAYAATFGSPLCITDSYRSLDAQVDAHHRKPAITAVPGTSNHGWGLAVDLCGGVNVFGTTQTAWMQANAAHYGWVHPDWAQADGRNPEPWHWEYGHLIS
ncbi:Membrane metalloendopeptidase [Modestobacter italicus]|uniref:Membrane metalloendopeptidase n=1 Tax=Modestobacter italicus (strain DSM 44449 / CECT 9708 / BC 501) TaxID=2732864 RepID=I4ESY7_MODI5|nr:Membrane metalloendopeptidase [Modestobacter marinus]